jgi:hypothetical protein
MDPDPGGQKLTDPAPDPQHCTVVNTSHPYLQILFYSSADELEYLKKKKTVAYYFILINFVVYVAVVQLHDEHPALYSGVRPLLLRGHGDSL